MTTDKKSILKLLKTSKGQIDGIIKMVEEDKYCIDISQQLLSVEAIINKVNKVVLTEHLKSCVNNAKTEEEKNEKIDEFTKMLAKVIK